MQRTQKKTTKINLFIRIKDAEVMMYVPKDPAFYGEALEILHELLAFVEEGVNFKVQEKLEEYIYTISYHSDQKAFKRKAQWVIRRDITVVGLSE